MSSLPQENLESLLAHVAMGDRASFEVLFDKTSAKLFGVCLRILNDETQAQDALQEAYARIWDKAEAYRVNGFAPMTWLVTVARNIAIDRRRARPKDAQGLYAADVIPDAGLDPDAQSIAQSDAPRIQTCLAALPNGHATLIRRAYLDGDSYADLAATTDAPLDSIRTGLRRSLSALIECLSQNDSRPEQEDEALAAEYVLGLLGKDEVKTFDKRLRDDPALRDIVAGWADQFALLSEELPQVAPSPELRQRVLDDLSGEDHEPIWQSLLSYFIAGLATAALAWSALNFGLFDGDPDPVLRADLSPDTGAFHLTAQVYPRQPALRIARRAGEPPHGKVHQLWLIAGNAEPISLGVLDADGQTDLVLTDDILIQLAGASLAISEEPVGGSPTGAPSGALLATGALTAS